MTPADSHPDLDAEPERIDPAWSVNEVIVRYPESIAVLNAFGLDTCCGGAEPIGLAASEAGIALPTLLAALERVAR